MQYYTIQELLKDIEAGEKVFPLQTINSLAKRWDKKHGAVFNQTVRDPLFPKAIEGIVEGLTHNRRVFPMHLILKYEEEKGIEVNERIRKIERN